MMYGKGKLVDGKLVIVDQKEIDQTSLTADCWPVQFNGLKECETCQYRGKKSCGGGETLKRLQAQEKAKESK